jgi:high-affinity Fe2+/Pb2+ permease
MSGTSAVVATLLALLLAAAGVAWWGWNQLSDVEMGWHGYIALALGVVVTTCLGVGLMWLVYFSHHRGYDDEVGRD